jgi:hypothetical protein
MPILKRKDCDTEERTITVILLNRSQLVSYFLWGKRAAVDEVLVSI